MPKSSPPPFERAFTLIEMIVVLAVIAIMMSLVYPAYLGISERAKATKDMSNLRQIATATQMYMNDNNGVFPGSGTATWMLQLERNQKYLSSWRVLESPFDKRSTSELGDATTRISYGINANVLPGNVAISADKITKPVTFIVFAPAQASTAGEAAARTPSRRTRGPSAPLSPAWPRRTTPSAGAAPRRRSASASGTGRRLYAS